MIKETVGGGFKDFFIFTPVWGKVSNFDEYFSDGLKPPTRTVKTPNMNRDSENDVFF